MTDFILYLTRSMTTYFPQQIWVFNLILIISRLQLLALPLILTSITVEDLNWSPIYLTNRIANGFYFDFTTDPDSQIVIFAFIHLYIWLTFFLFVIVILGYRYPLPLHKYILTLWNIVCYCHVYFMTFGCFSFSVDILYSYFMDGAKFQPFLRDHGWTTVALSIAGIVWTTTLMTMILYLVPSGVKIKGRFSIKSGMGLVVEAGERMFLLCIYRGAAGASTQVFLIIINLFISESRMFIERSRFSYWNLLSNKLNQQMMGPNHIIVFLNLFGYIHYRISGQPQRLYLVLWVWLIPISIKLSNSVFRFQLTDSLLMTKHHTRWLILSRRSIVNYFQSKKLRTNESAEIENNYRIWLAGITTQLAKKMGVEVTDCKKLILADYEKLSNKYPKFLPYSFSYIDLLLKYDGSPPKIFTLLAILEAKSKNIRNKMGVVLLKEKLREKLLFICETVKGENEFDIAQYIRIQNLVMDMKTMITSQTQTQIKFWQEFSLEDTKFSTLFKYSKEVQKKQQVIKNVWRQYEVFNIKGYHTPGLIYSLYLSFVCNQPRSGMKVLNLYEKKITVAGASRVLNNNTLFQNNTMYILVSLRKDTSGIVTDCSQSCGEYLGYKKEDLLHKSINILMTSFFAEKHPDKLARYYETGRKVFTGKVQSVFFKHKSKFILEGNVFTCLNPHFTSDLSMISLIKIAQDQKKYILVRQDGTIDGYSENLQHLVKHASSIFDISSEFQTILAQLNGKSMSKMNLFTLRSFEIKASSISMKEKSIYDGGVTINIVSSGTEHNKKNRFSLSFSTIVIDDDKLHVISFEERQRDELEHKASKRINFTSADDDSADNLFDTIGNESLPMEMRPSQQRIDFERNFIKRETEMEELIQEEKQEEVPNKFHYSKKRITEITEAEKNVSYMMLNFSPQQNKNTEDKTPNILKRVYNKSSSLGSNSSKSKTERLLEKGVSYYLIKPKYIVFKWLLLVFIIIVMSLMLNVGTYAIDKQAHIHDLVLIYYNGILRNDGEVVLAYNMRQLEFISSGALGNITDSTYDTYNYFLNLTVPMVSVPNSKLIGRMKNLEPEFQKLFYQRVPISIFEHGIKTPQTKYMDSFQSSQESLVITYEILNSYTPGITPKPDERIPYLQYNMLNNVLLQNHFAVESVNNYIDVVAEDAEIYVKTLSAISLSITIILIGMILAAFSFLNQDQEEFAKAMSKITEHSSSGMVKLLQAISKAVEDEIRKGSHKLEKLKDEIEKDKKEVKGKIYYSKFISMNKAKISNLLLVLRICPMVIIILVIVLAILLVVLQSIQIIQNYEEQIDSSLNLLHASDSSLYCSVEAVLNPDAYFKGQPIYSQAVLLNHLATQTDYWTNKLNAQSDPVVQEILSGLDCNDPRLGILEYEVKLCFELSGGNKVGLLQIMAVLSMQSSKMLEKYYSPNQTLQRKVDGMLYLYDTYEKTNFFENHYLTLLLDRALNLMEIEILSQKNQIINALVAVFVTTIILMIYLYVTVLSQITHQGNEVKAMFGLFPYTLIIKTRSLKDYLVRHCGKLGNSIRNLT